MQEPALFTLEVLEKRLAAHPASPLFARLANLYLAAERLENAREVCERGITQYPDYATGHLILGECYFHLRRFVDARRELNTTLVLQPKCLKARELLLRIDAAERASAEKNKIQPVREKTLNQEEVHVAAPSSSSEASNLIGEYWIDDPSTEIATPTLAEIYAGQGAYREAIRTYSVFLRRNPEERARVEQRIRELEEKWRALQPPS